MSTQPSSFPRRSLLSAPLAVGALAAIGAAPTSATATPTPRSLRIMAFNMFHGAGPDGKLDLEHTAQVIASSGADAIGLQEVDRHWSSRSDFVDQTAWLARRLRLNYAYGANLDLDPPAGRSERRQYGNAVLSRFPIVSATNHLLTSIPYPTKPTEQRGLLQTTLDVRGTTIDFCSAHLDHQRAEQRISQSREIIQILSHSDRPTIIASDLNTEPGTEELQILLDAGFGDLFADVADNLTFPVPTATKRIDYLLARRTSNWRDREVVKVLAADHYPVFAKVTV